jgi:hypothetical protein
MNFDRRLRNVAEAEAALAVQERQLASDWQRFADTWRAGWTPPRIVIAGLVAGFLVGRAAPLRQIASGGTLQLIGALSQLFPSTLLRSTLSTSTLSTSTPTAEPSAATEPTAHQQPVDA